MSFFRKITISVDLCAIYIHIIDITESPIDSIAFISNATYVSSFLIVWQLPFYMLSSQLDMGCIPPFIV